MLMCMQAFYKSTFPATAKLCRHHPCLFLAPPPMLFNSTFSKPPRCLWPVSAPSVRWGFSASARMGSEASLWAPHTWLQGLPDLNLAPERVVFLAQGNSCIPLTPEQRRKV